jgi:hypothetical protein
MAFSSVNAFNEIAYVPPTSPDTFGRILYHYTFNTRDISGVFKDASGNLINNYQTPWYLKNQVTQTYDLLLIDGSGSAYGHNGIVANTAYQNTWTNYSPQYNIRGITTTYGIPVGDTCFFSGGDMYSGVKNVNFFIGTQNLPSIDITAGFSCAFWTYIPTRSYGGTLDNQMPDRTALNEYLFSLSNRNNITAAAGQQMFAISYRFKQDVPLVGANRVQLYLPSSDGANSVGVDMGNDGDAGGVIVSNSSWNHVAVSFDYGTLTATLYINGTQAGYTGKFSASGINTNRFYPSYFTVGSISDNRVQSFNGIYQGYMSDIRIYNSALNDTQIKMIYDYFKYYHI